MANKRNAEGLLWFLENFSKNHKRLSHATSIAGLQVFFFFLTYVPTLLGVLIQCRREFDCAIRMWNFHHFFFTFSGKWNKPLTRYKRTGHPTLCFTIFFALSSSCEFGPNATKRYVPPMATTQPRKDRPCCSENNNTIISFTFKDVKKKLKMNVCLNVCLLEHVRTAFDKAFPVQKRK